MRHNKCYDSRDIFCGRFKDAVGVQEQGFHLLSIRCDHGGEQLHSQMPSFVSVAPASTT
jgi:hypothetical protein